MDYRYTNEDHFTAAINITLQELNTVLRILGPISKDTADDNYLGARNLHSKFEAIRKEAIECAVQGLTYQLETLNK